MTLASVGATCATATPAFADVEPNNVISQAEGPVGGGAPITGTLATPDDVDYYVFYAASQQQLHLTADDLTNDPGDECLNAGLEDTNGASVDSSYTTPSGTNRFFVHISARDEFGCTNPETYRFEIDPGAGVTTGPPLDHALSPTGEPNETPGQAIGPLQGAVNYVGAHDTTNDQDWFYFFVAPGTHQIDVSTTSPAPPPGYDCNSEVELFDSPTSDSSAQSASADAFDFAHVNQTLTGPAEYWIRAGVNDDSCLGARWQFRIEPAGALTQTLQTPPPPPPPPPVARSRYATYMSLRRRGARYSGRLSSPRTGCRIGRRVVLRRRGSGATSFGAHYSQADGTFSIKRSSRLRGQVYAVAPQRTGSAAICRSGRSASIRG